MDKVYAESYIRLSYKILEVMLKPFQSMCDTYTNNLSIFLSWSNLGPDLECLKDIVQPKKRGVERGTIRTVLISYTIADIFFKHLKG